MREKQLTTKSAARKSEITFYTLMIALPILQFVIFYIIVNANSFLLAFEKYDSTLGKYVWVGMDNIVDQIMEFQSGGILYRAVFSSLRVYGLSLLMLPLEVLFPYYIYKKLPGASFFKVILFLPHILSSLVLTLLYQYFVNSVIPDVAMKLLDMNIPVLMRGDTSFITAWIYTALFGFTTVLMYHGSMSNISKSVTEYAWIDGCSLLQEFWYITLPNIMPTIMVYVISGISGIFSNQLNLYNYFRGDLSHAVTVGYLIFARTTGTGMAAYNVPAATGLIFTCIVTPIVIILRRIAKRYTNVA